jgi:glucokinase
MGRTNNDAARNRFVLVGDVGGTNARFALADLSQTPSAILQVRDCSSRAHASILESVLAYLDDADLAVRPASAVIAAAGPIADGTVHFTNLGTTRSETQLRDAGFARARLVNDFEALALAMPHLGAQDAHAIGAVTAASRAKPIAVIGPGTGFGAAALLPWNGQNIALPGEGGHASFAPADESEREILRVLARRYSHVSIERVLSGPGLCNLHAALLALDGVAAEASDPAEITRRGVAGEEPYRRTVQRFCAILGSVAGDFALCYGAQGGVYIAGGIAPSILGALDTSEFRQRFEAKGRFREYLRAIPTFVVTRNHAALLGAAELAREWPTA